jgi:hypothetical protein
MVGGKANRGTAIGATGIAAVFATALAVAVGISAVAQSLRPESSAHRIDEDHGRVHALFEFSDSQIPERSIPADSRCILLRRQRGSSERCR